jgi:beta-glucosidase
MRLNKPNGRLVLGYLLGEHAPGLRLSFAYGLQAAHNLMLAHGKVVQKIRAGARRASALGVAPDGSPHMPAFDGREDLAAARRAVVSISDPVHFNHDWFGDSVILGCYPETLAGNFAQDWRTVGSREIKTICHMACPTRIGYT